MAPKVVLHGRVSRRYNALAEEYGLDILNDLSDELQARYGITL